MTAVLLLVGDRPFSDKTLERIRPLTEAEINTAQSYGEAETLIYSSPPDVLLLEATQPLSWELCRQLKQAGQLGWIYCILLEHQPASVPTATVPISSTIAALEAGANAYLWLSAASATATHSEGERLLKAHIEAGLRQSKMHRDLSQENNLLSAIALSDSLTQISNRRAFDWELPRQIKSAQEKAADLSLMMIDIDYFKVVNDTHGHLVGDEVLRLLAERLKHNMRFDDTPYRYGGEEFVIVLANTGKAEATQIAQRLCQLICQHPFRVNQTLALALTVSIGVASLRRDEAESGMELLQRADQNLLKAKSAGRNQIVSS
ncbi:diguanylate cyclase [Almyronema epifaneia]|uniref:Diguanylate cyclase n=1 Tax=Almyronema epifaneia S1 TaxID=2991925 RepID=A0ABW6IEE9_9CYAN